MTAWLLAQATRSADGSESLSEIPLFNEFFLRTLLVLVAVLVVSVVLLKLVLPLWLRRTARRGPGLIEVVETHRLESRKTIYLLRVGSQYYLVGSCDGRLTTLAGEPLDAERIRDAIRHGVKNADPPTIANLTGKHGDAVESERRR